MPGWSDSNSFTLSAPALGEMAVICPSVPMGSALLCLKGMTKKTNPNVTVARYLGFEAQTRYCASAAWQNPCKINMNGCAIVYLKVKALAKMESEGLHTQSPELKSPL